MQRSSLGLLPHEVAKFNASFESRYIHRFAGGAGFCAELVGLLKMAVRCWQSGFGLTLGTSGLQKGIATQNGLSDFFEPIFPEYQHRLLHFLNRTQFPGGARGPLNLPAVCVLRAMCGDARYAPEEHRFEPLPKRISFSAIGLDNEFWDGMSQICHAIYSPRPEILELHTKQKYNFHLGDSYLAIHIRRGDKISETAYTDLSRYIVAVEQNSTGAEKIIIAGDDYKYVQTLRKMLSGFETVTLCDDTRQGYDQKKFDLLPEVERVSQLTSFFSELMFLANSRVFIGTSTSNIYYFLRYWRGNRNIVDAHGIQV